MWGNGNQYHVIIYDEEDKVIMAHAGLYQVEVDGNTVRHLRGEIRGIKQNFIVVDDIFVGDQIKKGDSVKPEWKEKNEKNNKPTKEKKEADRWAGVEVRIKALEDRLAKLEDKQAKT